MSINMFQRICELQPDTKILFISLEQTRNQWFERAHRINTFYDPWASYQDTINLWKDRLLIMDKNRITQDELRSCIEQFEYEMGVLPTFVCVDYLGYYGRSYKGDAYERTSAAVMGLKAVAKDYQTIIWALHQVNRTGDYGKRLRADMARESGVVEETADMQFSLWNSAQGEKDQHQEDGLIGMEILKSRDGPIGQEIYFKFAPLTLAIVPASDPRSDLVAKERLFAQNGDSWETAVYRYRVGDETTVVPDPEVVKKVLEQPRPDDWRSSWAGTAF
jgi:replicative DNA helicase